MASENSSTHSSQESPNSSPQQHSPTTFEKEKLQKPSSLTETKKRKRQSEDVLEPKLENLELGEPIQGEDEASKELAQEANRYVPIFVLNLPWCQESKYKELLEILQFQGWVNCFGLHAIDFVYPKAMDEFCENFSYSKGKISSMVNGVDISFDSDYLANLFEIPCDGYDNYFKGKYNLKIGKIGKDEILLSLGGEKGISTIDHNSLSPINKLLFNLVRRTILARTQKRSEANLLDCAVIYCLTNRIKVNFPSLMISHLDHTVPSGYKVGYGTLLTKIFKSFQVPLEQYGKLALRKEQYIQGSTLHSLNLGVLNGKTLLYTEILRMEEEKKKKEEEEKKKKEKETKTKAKTRPTVRKSRRINKKDGPIPTVNLEEEEAEVEEDKGTHGSGTSEEIMKEFENLKLKHLDIEGQIFMMRQTLGNLRVVLENRHEAIMLYLSQIRAAVGFSVSGAAGTSLDKEAAGTSLAKEAAGTPKVTEQTPDDAIPPS